MPRPEISPSARAQDSLNVVLCAASIACCSAGTPCERERSGLFWTNTSRGLLEMEHVVQPRSKRTRTDAAPTTDDAVVSRLLVQAVSNAVVQTGSQVLNDLIASDQEELQQVSWTRARPSSPQLLPSIDLRRAASCSGAALPAGGALVERPL